EGRSYGNRVEMTIQGGHRNLFGTARSISLHITPALVYDFGNGGVHNIENRLNLRFVEPWVLYTRTPGVLNVFYEQHRPINSGSFDLTGASFGMSHKLNDDSRINGALSAKFVRQLSEQEIDSAYVEEYQTNQNTIYALTFYWKEDTRQNIFYPENSSYTDASVAFSYSKGRDSLGLPVTNKYIRFVSSWQRYQPFRPKIFNFKRFDFTLASRVKVGAIFEPWQNREIPINDRFYAGGSATVRGYQESLLGPALEFDENGKIKKAAGGKLMFLANIEVRMPIVWLLVLETFMDSGYVWPELKSFRPADIRFTAGIGIALITPLGPIRLDYGYKLTPRDIDPTRDAVHLGIYFAF
ncbi:MAG TPA: outer membrane protein assembly factor, partial [Caldithrix abyssi]|nr:outer membrane protein assembly factor [Caldithrix abyssi]